MNGIRSRQPETLDLFRADEYGRSQFDYIDRIGKQLANTLPAEGIAHRIDLDLCHLRRDAAQSSPIGQFEDQTDRFSLQADPRLPLIIKGGDSGRTRRGRP